MSQCDKDGLHECAEGEAVTRTVLREHVDELLEQFDLSDVLSALEDWARTDDDSSTADALKSARQLREAVEELT